MDAGQIARRFPLVARPRPACRPLAERVQEITDLARSAEQDANLQSAAVAQNMAALIVSDCGLPDLARALCWRHAEAYLNSQPLGVQEARYCLEPLVNLARLHIRNGDGDAGFQLLDTLNTAVRAKEKEAVIDGRTVSFRHLTATTEDHQKLRQWLWAILLGDGTRALVAGGRWESAQTHTAHHKGVGERLLDGRQVHVVARCLGGDPASALRFLTSSKLSDEWEHAVAASLAALCLTVSSESSAEATAHMVSSYLDLDAGPELAVFRTCLGATVLDLCELHIHAAAVEVRDRLIRTAVQSEDGYVAREVLGHEACEQSMSPDQRRVLSQAVSAAGLDQGRMPEDLAQVLQTAVDASARATQRLLTRPL
ncbi:hypothetical protein [Streptomyces boluensis]|uniref:Uncharacterized protein n=1 Tax=Streptomyces boluensis TaxID=1775135 RepID=A0A964XPL0_9ACTN|nr:hypothetical protein [Streptomyces boluensis]NBE54892.1 hypothetical protein [Streptomyces boluensis]